MKQVLQNFRNGRLVVADVPAPTVAAGQILVRTQSSLISAGTERATVEFARKSIAGKALSRLDLVSKVVQKVRSEGIQETLRMVQSRLDAPAALGYSCAGEVVAVGADVDEFRVGDRVACSGQNYASHAEFVCVPKNLTVAVPDGVSFADACYVTLGAIALQGVRQASPSIGEIVAVVGLGLLGQITVQILKANGCRVIGSDLSPERCRIAKELGADVVAVPSELVGGVDGFTSGKGVDAVIIAASTKSDQPVSQAALISRKRGRVVVVGGVGMNLPREAFYLRELELKLSTSYGPGRYDADYEEGGHDYPYAYVRWTERRNMEAFMELLRSGSVNVNRLTTHRYEIDDAATAYEYLSDAGEAPLGVLLNYSADPTPPKATKVLSVPPRSMGTLNVALIGAGSHALDRLVPALQSMPKAKVTAVCAATGRTADRVARFVGASYATTDFREVLDDSGIHAVVIATRHDLHAKIVTEALSRGKHVFVEKPLCLTEEELDTIASEHERVAASGTRLFVGYNRRYSAHTEHIRTLFQGRCQALTVSYRVNAGSVDPGHWSVDPLLGGGRIIGEACHFLDFIQHVCGSRIRSVFAASPASAGPSCVNEAVILVRLHDGSVGSVVYSGSGDKGIGKERCEIFGAGVSVAMNDFRTTEIYRAGKTTRFKTGRQDKGYANQIASFLRAVRDPAAPTQSFEDAWTVSKATLQAVRSVLDGRRHEPATPNTLLLEEQHVAVA